MLAAEKHKATFMAPIGIGLTLFVCQLFGTLWTGCGMNPARALGPSVITGRYPGYRESPRQSVVDLCHRTNGDPQTGFTGSDRSSEAFLRHSSTRF